MVKQKSIIKGLTREGNVDNDEFTKLTNSKLTITEESININDEETCEKLLFCFDDKNEELDLKDKELDEILFEDFKNKLASEEFEPDDNFDFEVDDSKLQNITLEQAVEDFSDGIDDAFNYIYAHYNPILTRWGRRYNNDELGSELLDIVLLSAVKTFNNKAGTKFNTYFWTCAQNYINCNRIKNNAQKRAHNKDMISLQQKCMYKNDQSETELGSMIEDKKSKDSTHDSELKLSILAMKDCLKENEIKILLRLIDNFTLQEIGDDLGVTAAAICMSLKRIGKKKNAAKKLREILVK